MWAILSWLTSGPLDRIFATVDKQIAATTDREKLKSDLAAEYIRAQAAVLTGRGWFFPLFFIAPLGFWFGAVCIYSVLWCRACAFPQYWTIAALPAPLNEWAGIIIGSLFLAKTGEAVIARLRK